MHMADPEKIIYLAHVGDAGHAEVAYRVKPNDDFPDTHSVGATHCLTSEKDIPEGAKVVWSGPEKDCRSAYEPKGFTLPPDFSHFTPEF